MGLLRYIRLETTWSHSDWLVPLSPAARLAWPELLCYVKAHGRDGRARAMPNAMAVRVWNIPESDISAMIVAATGEGALTVVGTEWVISKWEQYQGDPTSAERSKRYRADRSRLTPSRDATLHAVTDRSVTTDEMRQRKRLETTPSVSPPSGEKKNKGVRSQKVGIPADWQPTDKDRAMAVRLGIDCALEADKMRDWAASKGETRIDWPATFRNWLRNARPQIPAGSQASRMRMELPGKGRHGSNGFTPAGEVSPSGSHYWSEELKRWMPL